MLRFYAAATVIVLAGLLAIASLPHATRGAGDPQYSSGRGTPGPPQPDDSGRTAAPTTGEAPWALAVLPECFFELSRVAGAPAYVNARRPVGSRPMRPGEVLRVNDCTLTVGADSAVVTRGADRLVIPPAAHFAREGRDRLVFDRESRGREELRVFRLRAGGL